MIQRVERYKIIFCQIRKYKISLSLRCILLIFCEWEESISKTIIFMTCKITKYVPQYNSRQNQHVISKYQFLLFINVTKNLVDLDKYWYQIIIFSFWFLNWNKTTLQYFSYKSIEINKMFFIIIAFRYEWSACCKPWIIVNYKHPIFLDIFTSKMPTTISNQKKSMCMHLELLIVKPVLEEV